MRTNSAVRRIILVGIMLVLVFIVLSTATYAWYSANNVVTVDNVTFTSSANDADGMGLLAIGTDLNATTNNLSFDPPSEFHPMIPVSSAVIGETTYSEFVAGFNKTAEGLREGINGIAEWVAKLDGTAITPMTLTSSGENYFYVINRSSEDDFKIKVDYMFDESSSTGLKDKLHIAFFVGLNGAAEETLLGIASLSDIHYGAITAGDVIADTPKMPTSLKKASGEMYFFLNASQYAKIRLVVWLDGVDMKNEHGEKNMLFSLTFRGESV